MDSVSHILNYILHYSFVDPHATPALYSLQESARWMLICFALFFPLAFLTPGKPNQPKWRWDMITDGIYWFSGPFLYHPIYLWIVNYLLFGLFVVNSNWLNPYSKTSVIASWPVWVQAPLMLLAVDFLQYWAHRAFHKSALWKFHAIHHSGTEVDWMTSARFHPVNIILYSTLMNALVFLLGFSPAAYDALFLFNSLYSPLVHANVDWDYGPFKYVLASPVFHRWHHTHPDKGGDKNFAPTFPFLDLMFGTFYMPKGEQPEVFGAPYDSITGNFFQQLAYPFMTKRAEPEPVAAQESEAVKSS